MSETTLTLKSIFHVDVDKPIGSQPEFAKVLSALKAASAIPAASDEGVASAFNAALDQIMAVQLGDILLASWSKVATLSQAFETTHTDPSSVVILPLLDHKVSSRHLPSIDLLCAGKELAKLVFDVSLVMALKGVELEVRRGAISAVRGGQATGEGKLELAGKTLVQRTTPALALPGRLAFTPAAA